MHRTRHFRTIFNFVICIGILCASLFGQNTNDTEVDIAACWSYPLADGLGERISADDGNVFLGMSGGTVHAFSPAGKKVWSSEFGGEMTSNILVRQDRLFFVTSSFDNERKVIDSKLRWVSKETGITNWTHQLPAAERHFLSAYEGNIIVVSGNGVVQSIDAKNGNIRWTRQVAEGFAAEPSFTDTSVTVAAIGDQIFEISLSAGEIRSMRKPAIRSTVVSASSDGKLIVGDERGRVYTFNGDDRAAWSFKTGGAISEILSVGENILVSSQDNFVYLLTAANGGRVWKKRLGGRVANITSIDGKYVLTSGAYENSALLIDMAKGKVSGRMMFSENENTVAQPVGSGRFIYVLTNEAVYSYSLTGRAGCLKN